MKVDKALSFEAHRIEQRNRFAASWDAEQTLRWLEEALRFLDAAGVDYLAAKHREHRRDIWRTGKR